MKIGATFAPLEQKMKYKRPTATNVPTSLSTADVCRICNVRQRIQDFG
jgi:hypothetical protein